jgi:hypothetical protein
MPRPHIEFLHAQQLPWRPAIFSDSHWHGIDCKVLSRDAASGACSVLLRLPAGLERSAHALAAAEEWLVLEGSMRIGALEYGLDDYAYWPAGRRRASLESRCGAVLLAFFDREPTWQAPGPALAQPEPGCIERIATHDMPWTDHDIDPSVQFLRLTHKVLRHVPATGEKTLLLSTGAQTHPAGWQEAQLAHDCAEEMYLLGGDIIGERGTMYEGAYFWRPPGKWHGPFGSRRGSLSLIRFVEGHHRNIWGDTPQPFVLEPGHAPELPDSLPQDARAAWAPVRY